jgi:hypothetical protein
VRRAHRFTQAASVAQRQMVVPNQTVMFSQTVRGFNSNKRNVSRRKNDLF